MEHMTPAFVPLPRRWLLSAADPETAWRPAHHRHDFTAARDSDDVSATVLPVFWEEVVSKSKAKAKSKSKMKASAKRTAAKPRKTAARPAPTARVRTLADWRQGTLARMRALILEADPDMVEERKWRKPTNPAGVPTWSHAGIVCTGESYKTAVKLTFAHGASLPDPAKLFNAGLEGNLRRAIDIREGESVDAAAFKALIKAAVARNLAASKS
jgi:hypothetical protein